MKKKHACVNIWHISPSIWSTFAFGTQLDDYIITIRMINKWMFTLYFENLGVLTKKALGWTFWEFIKSSPFKGAHFVNKENNCNTCSLKHFGHFCQCTNKKSL